MLLQDNILVYYKKNVKTFISLNQNELVCILFVLSDYWYTIF